MARISTAMKRKLGRIQKRQETLASQKSYRVTSPFFLFDASIRIGGAGKFHNEITKNTGLSPIRSHLSGDRVSQRSTAVRNEDIWIFTSPLERTRPIEEHIDWLLNAVSPHVDYLSGITKNAAWADLMLGCLSDIPYPVIATGQSATELIRQLNLTVSFNFTCR